MHISLVCRHLLILILIRTSGRLALRQIILVLRRLWLVFLRLGLLLGLPRFFAFRFAALLKRFGHRRLYAIFRIAANSLGLGFLSLIAFLCIAK